MTIRQERTRSRPRRGRRLRVVLAGLLILALIGVMACALSQRQPIQPVFGKAYEAVVLRLEVVDGTPAVLVVGVNTEGRERQIARLPGAWVAYDIQASDTERGFLAPTASAALTLAPVVHRLVHIRN